MSKDDNDANRTDSRVEAKPSKASLALTRVYLRSGCFRDAEAAARRVISDHPSDAIEATLLLAEALLLQGRQDEAKASRLSIPSDLPENLRIDLSILDARLLTEAGKYQECVSRFTCAVESHADSISGILLQQVVAEALARLNDLAELRCKIEWIVAESERLGWTQGVADGLQKLGLVDRMEGFWARGDGLLLRAREVYRSLGLSKKYLQATLNLGLHRLFRGHLSFALDALSEATRLALEIGDSRFEATARADRGLALVRLGRMDEARAEFSRSLRLCRRQASPRRTAIALEYTGELHLAARNYSRASAALRRALAIANRIAPDGDIVPEVLRRQAEVALYSSSPEEALRIARDAATRAERYGDRYERATALRVQGQALCELNNDAEGQTLLRNALEILEELGETFERDRILGILGELELIPADSGDRDAPNDVALASRTATPTGVPIQAQLRSMANANGLFGTSRKLMDVIREAYQVSSLDLPILIQGETGTGKELLAQAIHRMGRWAGGPIVAFNCATCPPDLLDAELFGYRRGAYTGAHSNRMGLVRAAQGGTLFLDEVGELREESQARLLRFLDSGEIRALGSDETVRVQVRILAATHVDLEDRVERGRFRRDLYYRLTGLRLLIPPLRERRTDIRILIAHFTDEARHSIRPGFKGFGEDALRSMERSSWHGNVRELKSEVFRLAALSFDGSAVLDWTPPRRILESIRLEPVPDAPEVLADRDRLTAILNKYNGRAADVAIVLGISRGHIYKILKQHGIRVGSRRSFE